MTVAVSKKLILQECLRIDIYHVAGSFRWGKRVEEHAFMNSWKVLFPVCFKGIFFNFTAF